MYGSFQSYEERFWSKVDKSGDCWQWLAGTLHGYGVFSTCTDGRGQSHYAHRYSYELAHGPVPDGLTIDHVCHSRDKSCGGGDRCKHRKCVNPDHLEPVTNVENVMRGRSAAALNSVKTHCKRGHEFTAEMCRSDGTRACSTCQAEQKQIKRVARNVARLARGENIGPGRGNAMKTHCKYGHPYDEANTYFNKGSRFCRTCAKATQVKLAEKRKLR